MIVKVSPLHLRAGDMFYRVVIQHDQGGARSTLWLLRDELTSLILQLTGQLARLDQEGKA